MINIFIYTNGQQVETEHVISFLNNLKSEIPHNISIIDTQKNPDLYQGYKNQTPYIETGQLHLAYPFDDRDLLVVIKSAYERQERLLASDPGYANRLAAGRKITKSDKFGLWLANHYLAVINLIIAIYVGLPFLAPVLQRYGMKQAAQTIQNIYSPLCHQLAYRSWFLFGEQNAYPRELAHVSGLQTYEQATGFDSHDIILAKRFTGNQLLGYKVAFCERDVAIYGGMLFFSILFTIAGRKIKAIPWYIWIVIGILPMGLDGVSQLPSLIGVDLTFLPIRESTPLLRTITGALFGITTAWYGLPLFEETMRESKILLEKKIALIHSQ